MRALVILALCAWPLHTQPAVPHFDVAAIKPSIAVSGSSSGIYTGHGKVRAENVTLKRCIIGAYEVGPNQVFGGPAWLDSDRFEIVAEAEQNINDDHVLDQMLQLLLADRFHLQLHRETRTMSAFVLEVGKNGPKLEKAEGGESNTNTSSNDRNRTFVARNTGMDLFAEDLARTLDLPVLNKTGLEGVYNFKLEWVPENWTSPDGPTIFTAIQEQLGLRLRSQKVPVEVLVIDRAEKPSEN